MIKFGIQNGLNVARAGYSEDQILTACMLADRTGYDSIFYMDHTNVPQWKNAIVLDPWVMLSSIAAVTCLLYTSPSPRDQRGSRMPSSA